MVARARLRATKAHVVMATNRAREKRKELEESVKDHWEQIAAINFESVSESQNRTMRATSEQAERQQRRHRARDGPDSGPRISRFAVTQAL